MISLSLLLFLLLPACTVLTSFLPGSPYHPQGECSERPNSACTVCFYIWTLEQSRLQSTITRKTWQNNTYSLFRNDKEQPPWQLFFVILEPTLHLLDSFVLNHILEINPLGIGGGGLNTLQLQLPSVSIMFLRCTVMCFYKSEWD